MQIKYTHHRLFKVTDMSVQLIEKQESEAVNLMHV